MKKIVASIFCLVAVICIATGVFFTFNKSEMTATEALDKAMGNLSDDIKGFATSFSPSKHIVFDKEKTYNLKLNLKDSETDQGNIDTYFNLKNNNYLVNLNNDSENQHYSFYFNDNTFYYKLDDNSPYYYLTIEEMLNQLGITEDLSFFTDIFNSENIALTETQVNKITTLLKNSILDNINDSDFSTDDEDLVLGSKKVATKKYSLKITDKLVNKVLVDFLEKIRKDKELVSAFENTIKNNPLIKLFLANESSLKENIAESFEVMPTANDEDTTSDVSNEIDFDVILGQLIDQLNAQEITNEELFNFAMYINDDEIVSYNVTIMVDEQSVSLVLNDYENSEGFNNKELMILSGGSEFLSVKYNGVSKTKKNIEVILTGQQYMTGTEEITDTKYELVINLGNESLGNTGVSLSYVDEVVEEGKEEKYKINLKVTDEEDETQEITFEASLKDAGGMPKVDISDSVKGLIEDLQKLEG